MEIPPSVRYTEREGGSIAFQAFGDGDVDVLVISDPPSHLDLIWTDSGYVDVMLGLADRRRVITFDRRGTGLSDPVGETPTLESQALDLEAVVDAAGAGPAVLFGYGSSTCVAAYFAATRPDRVSRLILLIPWSRGWEDDPSWDPAARDHALATLHSALDHWGEGRMLEFAAPALDTPRNRRLFGMLERASVSRALVGHIFDVGVRTDLSSLLPQIQAPTLVIHHEDTLVPHSVVAATAELIPEAVVVSVGYRDQPTAMSDYWLPVLDAINGWLVPDRETRAYTRTVSSLLFTDLVGSTEHAARLGDTAWRGLLMRHDDLIRELVDGEGGRMIKNIGDGSLSAFDGPASAIRCGLRAVQAIGELGLEARAGVHTGECERIGLDLAGMAVHVASRVESTAAPGEVLVTRDAMSLSRGSGLKFSDRGRFELKGVPGEWDLFAAVDGDHPAVAAGQPELRMTDRAMLAAARRTPGLLRTLNRRLTGRSG